MIPTTCGFCIMHTHTHTQMFACMFVCVSLCMHALWCDYVCLCLGVHKYVFVCLFVCAYVQRCVLFWACVYILLKQVLISFKIISIILKQKLRISWPVLIWSIDCRCINADFNDRRKHKSGNLKTKVR